MTDPSLDPIFGFLREQSGRDGFTALREQLLQKGHDPALVDRAIAVYQHENPPKAPVEVWPKALPVAIANVLLTLFMSEDVLLGDGHTVVTPIRSVVLLVLCGELLMGAGLLLWPKARLWGRALLFGLLPALALVLLLAGVCLPIFLSRRH